MAHTFKTLHDGKAPDLAAVTHFTRYPVKCTSTVLVLPLWHDPLMQPVLINIFKTRLLQES